MNGRGGGDEENGDGEKAEPGGGVSTATSAGAPGAKVFEERGSPFFERCRRPLLFLLAGHGLEGEPRLLGFRGGHGGDFGGHGVGRGDLGGGAPATHRSRLDGNRRGRRLGGLRRPAALRRCRRFLLLALLALQRARINATCSSLSGVR